MPQVTAPVTHKCSGCPRHFDGPEDLAPARVGNELHAFCRRCYMSALGATYPISFELAQELGAE